MGNSPEEHERITEEFLRRYIENKLSAEDRNLVEYSLRESKETFLKYVSLKEALFLESKGQKIPKEVEDRLISSILPKKDSNYLRILVRFKDNQVVVTTSDQNALDFRSIIMNAEGSPSKQGEVSISRKILDRDLTLTILPSDHREEQLLSLSLTKSEGIMAELFVDGEISDRIEDLSRRQLFLPNINSSNSVEIKLVENGKVIFTLGLYLQIET
ncbi:hypothetical protein [Leptospira interrogans]|uniref:Uncharacterized protein n=1 Tax=Leptospira interrogans serovar Canicola TaxID=211880 RepID=A0AAP9WFS4_LEPIR|nr:hypothetical protein [Leptospira interrogans]EKR16761.1 hypothetical protein LEP1GSC019_0059 [Leptospira interrogans serovar Pyrogenes str. 2006006960]QOI44923.1 hypothetical protein Lepto782_22160 [Leptospira interrogans serovar Canicola]